MSKTYVPTHLRAEVIRRAEGRCEYCSIPGFAVLFSHHIDHIIPEKQGGPTVLENLACACQHCNVRKGDSVVAFSYEWQESTPLYNPRQSGWDAHFILQVSGRIEAKTRIGEATLRLLQINRLDRIARRKVLIGQELM